MENKTLSQYKKIEALRKQKAREASARFYVKKKEAKRVELLLSSFTPQQRAAYEKGVKEYLDNPLNSLS